MTARTRASLKTDFENGDIPQETAFSDLIDSFVNLQDTTQQSLSGDLSTPQLITAQLSAQNANIGDIAATNGSIGTLSVSDLTVNNITITGRAYLMASVSSGTTFVTASGGTSKAFNEPFVPTFNVSFSANSTGNVIYKGSETHVLDIGYNISIRTTTGSGDVNYTLIKNSATTLYTIRGELDNQFDTQLVFRVLNQVAPNDRFHLEVMTSSLSGSTKTLQMQNCQIIAIQVD
jgi:hypothetical protein